MDKLVNEELNRCGYNVTEKLKKIWEIELGLARAFMEVCQKYDIQFFAWAGTMLGAVRHNGFIPWDDDFDFALTRDNFNKLLEHADEFEEPYFLQHALNDRRFFLDYARLRDSTTTGVVTWNMSPEYKGGIYIDIYVLDGMPETALGLNWLTVRKKFMRKIFHTYYLDNVKKDNGHIGITGALFHLIGSQRSYEEWYKKYCKLLSAYTDNSSKLTLMTHQRHVIRKYWCDREVVKDLVYMKFEKLEIPVIANYEIVLKNMYGNYMEFPPVEERGAWHNHQIIFDPEMPYKQFFEEKERNEYI